MPSADGEPIRAAALDAITVDAFGTLLRLDDPAPALRLALAEHGVERPLDAVGRAFRAEAAYYRPRSLEGRDPQTLAALRRACVGVFLAELESELDPAAFAAPFIEAIVFDLAGGALAALDRLRDAGLALACVANWDVSLHEHLERLAVRDRFQAVVTSADARAEKPRPRIFHLALETLAVLPSRALHIGDEDADREGARRAGLAFEPVPLATLPVRIGL